MNQNRSETFYLTAGILLPTGVIFVSDLLIPLGWAVWQLYLIPLLLTFALPWPKFPLVFTGMCTVLVLIGFQYSPMGIKIEKLTDGWFN